jgi:NTP pyrophosphatase (non-canonical NTP hydrolase)
MQDRITPVQNLKELVTKFVAERDWLKAHNPKNLSMCIAIEAAELMEIFQWMNSEESLEICNTEEFVHLKEELADVLIYCISLANQLDIDIAGAVEDKMVKNGKKYRVTAGQ